MQGGSMVCFGKSGLTLVNNSGIHSYAQARYTRGTDARGNQPQFLTMLLIFARSGIVKTNLA